MNPTDPVGVVVDRDKLLLAFKIILRLEKLAASNLRESDPIFLTIQTLSDVLCDAVDQAPLTDGETHA